MSTYDLMASELREQRELAVATIQRQNELYESVSQQLQDARGEIKRKDAEIERLRGTLRALYGTYGVTLAWQRKWPNINRTILAVLKGSTDD